MSEAHFFPSPKRHGHWLSFILLFSLICGQGAVAMAAPAAPPPPPVLIVPEDGAITTGTSEPPVGVPTFRWAAVSGATRYHIQISASPGFASPVDESDTIALVYTPKMALADGIYYWRVRAGNATEWGSYSEVRSFTKDWSDGGTLLPHLLSPPAEAVLEAFDGDGFTWTPVTGAASYKFEIDDDPSFTSPNYQATTLARSHTPTSKLGNNRYYWRVTPLDRQGHLGTPSEVRAFTMSWSGAPVLLSPENNLIATFTPNFAWTAVAGAQQYFLEISTAPDFSAAITTYATRNTTFCPPEGLANDQEYYWRVRAMDAVGNSGSYSAVRRLEMRWHLVPEPLWPMNNWTGAPHPVFAWTPVAGAEKYEIWIDESPGFATPYKREVFAPWYAQTEYWDLRVALTWYWKVRGVDGRGNVTPWSETRSFTFGFPFSASPIFPLPYYEPRPDLTPVVDDPTVGFPLFVWDTVHDHSIGPPFPMADHYLLEVDDDPAFGSPNFVVETAGQAAAPTTDHPFNNLTTGLYYWRVKAYREGRLLAAESVQLARIDPANPGLPRKDTITLLYPADGHEVVVDPPILGWYPITGTTRYRVQIATDVAFTEIVDEAQPTSFHYVPFQGRTVRPVSGTYYWRVRSEVPQGSWSEVRHFNLSHRLLTSNTFDYQLPSPISTDSRNQVVLGPDEGLGVYDLTGLYAAQDRDPVQGLFWVFNVQGLDSADGEVSYAIYFDSDHVAGSGGVTDPLGNPFSATSLHLPEAVLYVERNAGNQVDRARLWQWNATGKAWNPPQTLSVLGGKAVMVNPGLLEIRIPHAAIPGVGVANWSGSLAMQVLTVPIAGGAIRDTIPDEPTTPLTHFAFTSDMVNLIYPFDTPLDAPITYRSLPPLRWFMPYWDSVDGYHLEIARDPAFTDIVYTWENYENTPLTPSPYYALLATAFVPLTPIEDNETYYWRVRVRHEHYVPLRPDLFDYGPWSKPFRFRLESHMPTNLQVTPASPTDRTPTFSWDRVNGAGAYRIQIDNDSNFSSPIIELDTNANTYTPDEPLIRTFRDGTYFWRVRIRRGRKGPVQGVYGPWTATQTFVKSSPAPLALRPAADEKVYTIPTFRWQGILTPTVEPKLAAPKYKVMVDDDPNFSSPLPVFVTDGVILTPDKGKKFLDGTWYWKVAMVGANGTDGPYGPVQRFYKEYESPELVSPAPGARVPLVPTFVWKPVDGAAYYQLEFGSDPAFIVKQTVSTDNTSYTPTLAFTYKTVYWRVRIFDLDNVGGSYETGRVSMGYVQFMPGVLRGGR